MTARSAAQDFWDDPETAQRAMQRLADLKDDVAPWNDLQARLTDLQELLVLAEADEDEVMLEELTSELHSAAQELDRLEDRLLLAGVHDKNDAILSIHAGAGGTDAQDWAEMLLRMYNRWAEQHDYKVAILDRTLGEEAGVKSVTIEVKGRYAYGLLRAERGVHRLVRLSAFDAAKRRHTSFALVEVIPVLGDEVEIELNLDDIKMDFFRSSGAGGQHVQKNSTAVRLTHMPTGIVVSCQNERSQVQNREVAMTILRARLYDLEMRKKEAEEARLKGEHVSAEWGNQIRSYVLHPYSMVKDHRTGHETGNPSAVLDGRIDSFIEAYLKMTVGQIAN